jgi:hypothetical protein
MSQLLGLDRSGNSNNWTTNNLAATDQMLDSPTNNFCTLNPLDKLGTPTLSEGNLNRSGTTNLESRGTMHVSSGKWYWEYYPYGSSNNWAMLGITSSDSTHTTVVTAAEAYWFYQVNGGILGSGASASYAYHWQSTSDIMGVALDLDNNELTFYRANALQDVYDRTTTPVTWADGVISIEAGSYTPSVNSAYNPAEGVFNFGQDSTFAGNKTAQGNQDSNDIGDFYYTPPSGFLALCTANLPDPTVIPSEHFNTVLYTGDNDLDDRVVNGVGFQPDLVWIKNRASAQSHGLIDAVRGGNKYLNSDANNAENAWSNTATTPLTFTADGFTLDTTSASGYWLNKSPDAHVAWNWKAGGTPVSNTDGSITSSVSANVDAGFSVVSYTGTGSNATIGHGLSQPPEMYIVKNRSSSTEWPIYVESIGNNYRLGLNSTSGSQSTNTWNYTSPTSTVFTVLGGGHGNLTGDNYISYAFHSVDGHSKFGSYTGNGSTDGTFVHTGFRPAYVMVKASSIVDTWIIMDDARSPFNPEDDVLYPNYSNPESVNDSNTKLDFLSNGFKLRHTNDAINKSGANYIFLAFAESPFKHSNAR